MNALALLDDLDGLGVEGLRAIWRDRWGEPPSVKAGDILRRALAERLQEEVFGVDGELDQRLKKLSSRYRPGLKPKPEGPSYKQGSLLVREWNGERHEVTVADGGYVWRGERYASLSKIARLITGVRWNGPRFFGLREGA